MQHMIYLKWQNLRMLMMDKGTKILFCEYLKFEIQACAWAVWSKEASDFSRAI